MGTVLYFKKERKILRTCLRLLCGATTIEILREAPPAFRDDVERALIADFDPCFVTDNEVRFVEYDTDKLVKALEKVLLEWNNRLNDVRGL